MKFILYFNKTIFLLFGSLLIFFLINSEVNADINSDIKKITSKLRCMTCQNQNVYSSDTEFSINIKKIVKEKLTQNASEKEIVDFLIYRYGEYIAFEPKISKQNIFLWLYPFVFLAISLGFFFVRVKKNH